MSRIQDAIVQATGYSVRGEQAEAVAGHESGGLDLGLLSVVADALNGGCQCEECEHERATQPSEGGEG